MWIGALSNQSWLTRRLLLQGTHFNQSATRAGLEVSFRPVGARFIQIIEKILKEPHQKKVIQWN
ncbi:hypothetical protein EFM38_00645 [Lentilactobacillus buchneri]|nr:hypothetical protein [Lentilactobacillus buchneri]MCT3542364.1 hypothetical protein [Lentilactobacillus buchneri]MCT3545493.1 hypothetical protein [Lentilactobacillus buchneri]MCT3553379.1 hypothetical protein [Lentilactobacillus buchneri]